MLCSSGSFSLTIMCITVVLPRGSDNTGRKIQWTFSDSMCTNDMYSIGYTLLSSISTLPSNSIVKSVHRAVVLIGLLVCVLRMQKGGKLWEFRSSEIASEAIFDSNSGQTTDVRPNQHDYILNCPLSLSMAVG